MSTPAAPPPRPAPAAGPPSTRGALALLALALLLAGLAAPAAATVPSTVLPGDTPGGEVALEPAAVRAPEGRAEVDVVVGDAAPGDVVVDLAVHQPEVDRAGVVTVGPTATGASVSAGGRLRPGERLRAVVTTDAPALLVATVRAASQGASDSRGDAPRELVALVLPGTPGAPPVAAIEAADGVLLGTVTADTPMLVSVRLRGAASTTHPDRLVLPDTPLVVRGQPAPWPLAAVLTVTDEEGRSVTASTSRGPLLGITALLLAVAAAATVHRWRRRVSVGAATGSSPQ